MEEGCTETGSVDHRRYWPLSSSPFDHVRDASRLSRPKLISSRDTKTTEKEQKDSYIYTYSIYIYIYIPSIYAMDEEEEEEHGEKENGKSKEGNAVWGGGILGMHRTSRRFIGRWRVEPSASCHEDGRAKRRELWVGSARRARTHTQEALSSN